MKKIGLVLIVTVAAAFCFYFIVFVLPFLFVPKEEIIDRSRCKDEMRAMEESVIGIITSKFKDMDSHMWETIDYSSSTGSNRSLIFMNDRSGAFDFIVPGDSLFKAKGSLVLIITRKEGSRKYQLDFGCSRNKPLNIKPL